MPIPSTRTLVKGLLSLLLFAVAAPPASAKKFAEYWPGDGAAAFSPDSDWGWLADGTQAGAGQSFADPNYGDLLTWQITDAAPGGAVPRYYFGLYNPLDLQLAATEGWRIAATARLANGYGDHPTQGLGAYYDDRLFLLMVDKTSSGQLVAHLLKDTPGTTQVALASGAAANDYYDYELRYDPTDGLVSFLFEGQERAQWGGVPTGDHDVVFQFGAGNALGTGQMNYRHVVVETLGTLGPTPTEQGDYNQDGRVDAADYTVWRSTLGSHSVLVADGNGNDVVDSADYGVWKSHFGDVVTNLVGSPVQAVPEPRSVAWGLVFMLVAAFRRGCRARCKIRIAS